ncbi:hypothetical protein PGT21_000709 [Puccinia graminis f. sp. tritici]|uniref:Uncharacterized protein n=1 Tax=Puccinia graminis f. sp. tritici TaxID=56615 RepID=A0A5B0R170_PUCGR|nr:hypothetical protein PGT21_000792 [Puccinia graminis f. sp. tritici]KAA1118664.1 hypothetical protein PGT21_000709 [Puccinia graminis f. sp. tritici]
MCRLSIGFFRRPPTCQFLDFNIRRINNLRGTRDQWRKRVDLFNDYLTGLERQIRAIEAIKLRVTEKSSTSELVSQGHKLFEGLLFLYPSVHAP